MKQPRKALNSAIQVAALQRRLGELTSANGELKGRLKTGEDALREEQLAVSELRGRLAAGEKSTVSDAQTAVFQRGTFLRVEGAAPCPYCLAPWPNSRVPCPIYVVPCPN